MSLGFLRAALINTATRTLGLDHVPCVTTEASAARPSVQTRVSPDAGEQGKGEETGLPIRSWKRSVIEAPKALFRLFGLHRPQGLHHFLCSRKQNSHPALGATAPTPAPRVKLSLHPPRSSTGQTHGPFLL